ncbi:TPA: fimbrial chaperone [Klebsiella oxytoca]|nr:fimbrial chaperone [Klebsiella oxytoca]
MKKNSYKSVLSCILGCLLFSGIIRPVQASVTMLGTRIIYDGGTKSTDVQLRNRDDFPYVITAWFDDGNPESGPQTPTSAPFIVTPPVFRIQPGAGQIVRVVFTGTGALPQDRESLFWFNFMQVPPANVADAADGRKKNGILVMLRNRVKLLYRPVGLDGDPQKMLQNLWVSRETRQGRSGITVANNQPFHITLTALRESDSPAISVTEEKDVIIPPFSQHFFPFAGKPMTGMKSVTITLINDQGARISENYSL